MKRNLRNGIFGWDPFREITQLQRQMNQLFESVFGGGSSPQPQALASGFTPAADVYEDGGVLKLRLEVPGVQPEDVDITLEGGVLTVKGERKLPEGENPDRYLAVESPYGPFYRSFVLPNTVDPGSLTANYVNGVLEVSMSKRAEARPKQIPIGSAAKGLGAGSNSPSTQAA